MSYLYQLKDGTDVEKLKEMGFSYLPAELYGSDEEHNILYKIIKQPLDGKCVQTLIDFYQSLSNTICSDRVARRAHVKMGIKYRMKNGKFNLIITQDLREMFSMWRLEIDFEIGDVYFTISDGSMPRFYDAEQVMEKYCKEDIDLLVLNNIIEKVENISV